MKVALVHDWLNGYRGGERVLEQLCLLFPTADIFTLFYRKGSVHPVIEKHAITPSWLNQLPGVHRYYRYLFPLYPIAIESLRLNDYDLVLSTSHCAAKGVLTPPGTRHICYCFTPVRYAWDQFDEYFKDHRFKPLLSFGMHSFRMWDAVSANRVDHFIAISHFVAGRIRKYYRRSADVVYPPVDTEFFQAPPDTRRRDYYLIVSAFAPYTRIDVAIDACEKTGRRLIVVGEGQSSTSLRKKASSRVQFLGRISTAELPQLYAEAKALLFPGEEDFGIAPLEAQSCGTPVIALGKGGALETLLHEKTGLFFDEPTADSLIAALDTFEKSEWKPSDCRLNAQRFSTARFIRDFTAQITASLRHEKNPLLPPRLFPA